MSTPVLTGPLAALAARIDDVVADLTDELVAIRRDIHAHPELARTEQRTTAAVAERLRAAGLSPRLLHGSGLVCDVGPSAASTGRRLVGLRADLDALPVPETTGLPFASTNAGVAHACGHDVHTSVVLGAGLALAELAASGDLAVGVRLVFQPAEEVMPGGALDVIEAGVLEGVEQVYALHCDPKVDVGAIGSRIGSITSASDTITVTLTSAGGHTSRPHLTGDVVFALGQVITQAPSVLGRRLDPRAGANLTWGSVRAGQAANAIPSVGTLRGTLRMLDAGAWEHAGAVLDDAIEQIVAPYGVGVEVTHVRGVPPVVNEERAVAIIEHAARTALGEEGVLLTEQSLGGEDFAWYLRRVPGAMVRLGTRTPGGPTYDIHRGDLVVDERAIGVGARILARTAIIAGSRPAPERLPVA
ncbi:amidohydrolase [Beutenbergia cavernae DSM 12333]|uniref:Amidohydrolase n=1 Tax=Beutenbergia cavernae (strain ATCC BAA-8 / DSM 12333 / CCUG 43141 / JCM 11478 / NBRC 16432 / NCIMB 13614 / HKI 0122) TaxID=471853 RepID=C5BZ78_BEUC1|nr:amidohydrolase [Beutenbergia cavernae]ACQ81193.1 amidohydrolase [Beutenbergia cavernae DSM 12333]